MVYATIRGETMIERVTLRGILIALSTVVLAASALGQDARFTIDRIEVRNSRRMLPTVIAGETLLHVGGDYTEEDIQAAVARLARLPFLASATYALENGSDAAHRVVVITVTEVWPISFLGDGRGILFDETATLLNHDYDYADPTTQWKDAAIGLRWLVGGRGYAHAAMTVLRTRQSFAKNHAAWEIGYTHHRIFGTRLFATVNVRTPVDSVGEGTFSPAVIVGIPLTASQTLTVDAEDTVFVKSPITLLGVSYPQSHVENRRSLTWTYDTTNGPFVRTRGTFVRVKPYRWMRDDADVRFVRGTPPFERITRHANANGVDVAALRYWELSENQSLFGGVLAGWADVDFESVRSRPSYEVLKGGYSRRLGPLDGRLELEARLGFSQPDQQNSFSFNDNDKSAEVLVSWAAKGAWGSVRIGAGYARGF
jgi:hypothetical protein